MANNNYSVIIDLKKLEEEGLICDEKALIHQKQIDEVCKIIRKRMAYKEYHPERKMHSMNDVVSIFARRGAGKTTFVKSLKKLISENQNGSFHGVDCSQLIVIDVIEPNQIQKKENFMVRFLAFIHSVFKAEISRMDEKNRKRFEEATNELYEAMPVMDGIGKLSMYSDWTDSDYVAENFMNLAMKAKDLEKRFHQYINVALDILGRKSLLFILDDCDVNIEKTFEILETIRLFFTSPQIIVLMTGDATLYGMTVRQNYWKFFDKDFLNKECDFAVSSENKQAAYRKMVSRLETQYLQKMIKPEHRILLDNVYEKYRYNRIASCEEEKYSIGIKFSNVQDGEPQELRQIYEMIFKTLGMINSNQADRDVFVNHLLRQPFRNQYRLLSIYNDFLAEHLYNMNSETSKIDLVDRILKVFEVYINQYSADNKHLMGKTSMYAAWIMKFLIDNDIVATGSHLLPNMESDSMNNAIIALDASCIRQMQTTPSIVFDYWSRVSFVRQVLILLGENGKEINEFAHLYNGNGVTKIQGNVLAYLNAKLNIVVNASKNTMPGVIVPKHRIMNQSGIKGLLVKLVQLSTVSPDTHKTRMCTIYRILAAITELLNEYERVQDSEANIHTVIKVKLLQVAQKYTFVEPNMLKPYLKKEKVNVTNSDKVVSMENVDTFVDTLLSWMEKAQNRIVITPQTLDRTFSRLYYTLNDMDTFGQDENNAFIGEYMSKWVISLWNSCIVEECLAENNIDDIDLSHDEDIIRIFLKNYNCFQKKIEKKEIDGVTSFSAWLLECPLLECYVDTDILALREYRALDINLYKLIKANSTKKILIAQKESLQKELNDVENSLRVLEQNISFADKLENIDKEIEVINMELEKKSNSYTKNKELLAHRSELSNERLSASRDVVESASFLYNQRQNKLAERRNLKRRISETEINLSKIGNLSMNDAVIRQISAKFSDFSVYKELAIEQR